MLNRYWQLIIEKIIISIRSLIGFFREKSTMFIIQKEVFEL